MGIIMTILLLGYIGVVGYIFMDKVGSFIDENTRIINENSRTKLIYVGFDMPCLVEDFLSKIDEIDSQHNSVEVMIYSGTADEIKKMLKEGAIDYAVISELISENDTDQMDRKEISLKPKKLRTDITNMRIDMVNCNYIKASALWIPDRIVKGKIFFTDLILQL